MAQPKSRDRLEQAFDRIADRIGADETPYHVILRLWQTSLDADHKRALAHAMKWLAEPHTVGRGLQ